jgi:hypothetical protein
VKLPFAVEHTGPNVLTVRMDVQRKGGWEQWFLLQSDEHWDNPHCDRAMLKRHHEEALKRNAGILKFGDTFCAMQGKYDKRSDKTCLRPEHQCGDYLDALVRTGADWYEPFAHNILLFGKGNHESSIRSRHETDLIERLVATVNDRAGSRIQAGGYGGWVWFQFRRQKQRLSRRLKYVHGFGGGGPVTKDTIQGQRLRASLGNPDIIAFGHTHDSWVMDDTREWLNDAGRVEHRPLWTVKCATYKDEYGNGAGGWHVETGKPPKPKGAQWLRFFWGGDGIMTELVRAQ